MLPLGRITDMKYQRTFFGLILGYGRFVLESAGEDQALREIEHVPHPDDVYHIITEEIFQQLRSGDGTGASARGEREPRRHAPFPSVSWMADQLGLAHKKTLGRVNLRGIRLPARRKPATSEASPASDVSRSRVSRSRSRLDESSVAKRSMSTKLANKMLGRDYEETAGQLETYQRTQEERRRLQQEQQEQQHASGGDLRTRDTGHIIDPE
ncbi:MAG: hypothetical protein CSB46_03730 [Micrococcales bacterium]|nr:MAG: hypothetical protein CSB46_03730 [Micrococcales bacterium]